MPQSKLVVAQRTLIENINLASLAVPTRTTFPILANIKLIPNPPQAPDKKPTITLIGFDLSFSVTTTFEVEALEDWIEITFPARLTKDIVGKLPDCELTITKDFDSNEVTISSKFGRYTINCQSAEEFPALPELQNKAETLLPVTAFQRGTRLTTFSASDDESKQVLTGIRVAVDDDGSMEFASTDGHRLSTVTVHPGTEEDAAATSTNPGDNEESLKVTIPANTLAIVSKLLDRVSEPETVKVTARFDESQAIFEVNDYRVTSRILEGQYPNYRQLIPRQYSRMVTLDRKTFASAVDRIAVLAEQKNNVVTLAIDSVNSQLAVRIDAAEVGSGKETIAAQVSGDDLEIAFNVKYLLQVLKILDCTEVSIQLNSATSPAIIQPVGGDNYTYLIMPVQIRS